MFLNDIILGLFLTFSAVALAVALIGYGRTREKRLLKLSVAFGFMLLKGLLLAQQYFTGVKIGDEISTLIDLIIVVSLFALFW